MFREGTRGETSATDPWKPSPCVLELLQSNIAIDVVYLVILGVTIHDNLVAESGHILICR